MWNKTRAILFSLSLTNNESTGSICNSSLYGVLRDFECKLIFISNHFCSWTFNIQYSNIYQKTLYCPFQISAQSYFWRNIPILIGPALENITKPRVFVFWYGIDVFANTILYDKARVVYTLYVFSFGTPGCGKPFYFSHSYPLLKFHVQLSVNPYILLAGNVFGGMRTTAARSKIRRWRFPVVLFSKKAGCQLTPSWHLTVHRYIGLPGKLLGSLLSVPSQTASWCALNVRLSPPNEKEQENITKCKINLKTRSENQLQKNESL